jgi:hypothetical protein
MRDCDDRMVSRAEITIGMQLAALWLTAARISRRARVEQVGFEVGAS